MTVAELFVNIGVKGEDKAKSKLATVSAGLQEVQSTSLAAKAAILAVFYGFEKLTGMAAARGMELAQFTNFTGLSTLELQKWQYAMRQSGVAADEVAGSVKTVQSAMTEMLAGHGAPSGMGILARAVGFDANQARNTFYVMDKLKQFLQMAPADLGNMVGKSFGLNENMIQGMRTNKVDFSKIPMSEMIGDKQRDALAKIDVQWMNLGNHIKMAFAGFTSAHGAQLIGDLAKISDSVIKLAGAFTVLAEKLKLFKVLGMAFEGWEKIFSLGSKGVDAVAGAVGNKDKQIDMRNNIVDFFKEMPSVFKAMGEDLFGGDPAPTSSLPSSNGGHTVNQQNTYNVHEANDPHRTVDHVKKHVNQSLMQIPAVLQGS